MMLEEDNISGKIPLNEDYYEVSSSNVFYTTVTNRYFFALIIYFGICLGYVLNDYFGNLKIKNQAYISFSISHLINALQFLYSWKNKAWLDVELFPEYLNITSAALYIWSSTLYGRIYADNQNGDDLVYTDEFFLCRSIELTASLLEVFACFGWCLVWYTMFLSVFGGVTTIGRGLSLFDPDLYANVSLIIGSILYLVYNIRVILYPYEYEENELYSIADWIFLFNAVAYLISSLRDFGWFDLIGYLYYRHKNIPIPLSNSEIRPLVKSDNVDQ